MGSACVVVHRAVLTTTRARARLIIIILIVFRRRRRRLHRIQLPSARARVSFIAHNSTRQFGGIETALVRICAQKQQQQQPKQHTTGERFFPAVAAAAAVRNKNPARPIRKSARVCARDRVHDACAFPRDHLRVERRGRVARAAL